MTSILWQDIEAIALKIDDPEERLILGEVDWEQYEKLLTHLGDSSRYRVTYLDGILEIMSPSRCHEVSAENIGRLLEVYLEEAEIDFWGLGSTTFRKQKKEVGKEPDKCYCINTDKEFPDIAIEVVLTSGGINTLEVYKRLEVKEVWFWQNNQLRIYHLNENGEYELQTASRLLPNLDISLLSKSVTALNPRLAMKEFRQELKLQLGNA
jgi:Uma2 family endonuclease